MSAMRGNAFRASSAIVLSNSGTNPEIEGYTWQEDTTWNDGEGLTVHLPDEGNWYKKVEELEKTDAYGNVYVYYIDSVTETGMPSGMTAQIILDGENKQFVYGDHSTEEGSVHTNDELQIKNILATGTTITILKVEKGNITKTLTGAEFSIQKYTDSTFIQKSGDPITGSVDANGCWNIPSLEIGYYKLEETKTPVGYVKVSNDPTFEVRQNPTTKEVEVVFTDTSMVTYANGTFTVQNEPGVALPSTGGPGTRLFTILGSILIAGAGMLLWRRRRLI